MPITPIGGIMSKSQNQGVRRPATKLPNLQKKMQKAAIAKTKAARKRGKGST